jgi:hypothetical protein
MTTKHQTEALNAKARDAADRVSDTIRQAQLQMMRLQRSRGGSSSAYRSTARGGLERAAMFL